MPGNETIGHSVLIVSAQEQFAAQVRRSLSGAAVAEVEKRAIPARRILLERYYDLVIINAPLPDESGEQFAMDVTRECRACVLLVMPAEGYEEALERVTDFGVMVLAKPLPCARLDKAIRLLFAFQNTLHGLEKEILSVREKMEEQRIVSRAKFFLVETRHMTEDEAHRYIGREAMNHGVSRKRIARMLLEE